MIFDAQNLFSKDQAVTTTALSTDVIDLGRGDAGPSEGLSALVTASTAFTGTGALSVELMTADVVDAGNLTSPVTIARYPVSTETLKRTGTMVSARLPHGCKRYVRMNYVVTGTLATGKVVAGLVLDASTREGTALGA